MSTEFAINRIRNLELTLTKAVTSDDISNIISQIDHFKSMLNYMIETRDNPPPPLPSPLIDWDLITGETPSERTESRLALLQARLAIETNEAIRQELIDRCQNCEQMLEHLNNPPPVPEPEAPLIDWDLITGDTMVERLTSKIALFDEKIASLNTENETDQIILEKLNNQRDHALAMLDHLNNLPAPVEPPAPLINDEDITGASLTERLQSVNSLIDARLLNETDTLIITQLQDRKMCCQVHLDYLNTHPEPIHSSDTLEDCLAHLTMVEELLTRGSPPPL